MARKNIPITHLYPFQIVARSNNKDWFKLPLSDCWQIFAQQLNFLSAQKDIKVHAFVLMSNHYHLIASTYEGKSLGLPMCRLQTTVSRTINTRTGRINHVFGGRYKPSLIKCELDYARTLKYVYRNPVTANVCSEVESYPWSTLNQHQLENKIVLTPIDSGIDALIPNCEYEKLRWLNEPFHDDLYMAIKRGLKQTEFRVVDRNRRKFESF
jgi:putative transposase